MLPYKWRVQNNKICHFLISLQYIRSITLKNSTEWKNITGFSRYEVSSCGDVRNRSTGRILKQYWTTTSPVVSLLDDNGKSKRHVVGRLVLSTFLPAKSDELCAAHKDGMVTNNRLENLEWRTRSEIMCNTIAKRTRPIGCVPVTLSLFENDAPISTTKCESIGECIKQINNFFDIPISYCRPYTHTNYVIRDKHSLSTKKCIVKYVDSSKYRRAVSNLSSDEKWKVQFEGKRRNQLVSNLGRVKSVWKGSKSSNYQRKEILKKESLANGYLRLCWNEPDSGRIAGAPTHRLVATLFVPNPNNYQFVDHIDGCKTNNRADNLRWVKDSKENVNNPNTRAKSINQTPVIQKDTKTDVTIKQWTNALTASTSLGYHNSSHILACCRGKLKQAYGYRWAFGTNS